jgi:hypothetical protein
MMPPLSFLQAVYTDDELPLSVRLKAAIAAAPFVHPKLSVTAVTDDAEDFAARLDRARARSAKVIEARAEPEPRPLTDLRSPPMVPDRRFRRA